MVSSLLTFLSYARKSKETATLADTPENEVLTLALSDDRRYLASSGKDPGVCM